LRQLGEVTAGTANRHPSARPLEQYREINRPPTLPTESALAREPLPAEDTEHDQAEQVLKALLKPIRKTSLTFEQN